MKNIERVWKAEQKYDAERKKIEELQKELKEERAREEITRYAEETGAIKDEYLLGRPIDKQITDQYEEPESGPSAETGLLPGSIFNPATPASGLDLAAKIREDPLFQIRNHKDSRSYSSSCHRADKKAEAKDASPQSEHYQRLRNHVSKKLSVEELERKRREMMEQAKQREEDRENNVKRYKRQDEQDKQREKNAKHNRHAGFIQYVRAEESPFVGTSLC
ncbi:hypothetical protein GOODEAATRI_029096 [Goodea atripinnis]|uniref:CBF1-interacting co-repressor CIR N-terminal domain-containing protein n=1 Tax=Goodea atripinnis TaxID=208336 RepID=A0ABV0PSP0_9TELE